MPVSRRRFVGGALASVPFALTAPRAFAQTGTTLKISHQFPGATGSEGAVNVALLEEARKRPENA